MEEKQRDLSGKPIESKKWKSDKEKAFEEQSGEEKKNRYVSYIWQCCL